MVRITCPNCFKESIHYKEKDLKAFEEKGFDKRYCCTNQECKKHYFISELTKSITAHIL
jgi:hypothetical protein